MINQIAASSIILITGGTGSFGSTVTRQLLAIDFAEIRILSRDEAKQDDMRRRLGDPRARFYVGDVRDPESVADAMSGVDYVFHAAALKQLPSCEFFPLQAIADYTSHNTYRLSVEQGRGTPGRVAEIQQVLAELGR